MTWYSYSMWSCPSLGFHLESLGPSHGHNNHLPSVPPLDQAHSPLRALCPRCPSLQHSAPRTGVSPCHSDLCSAKLLPNRSSLDTWFTGSSHSPPATHALPRRCVLVFASHISSSKFLFMYLFMIYLHPQECKYRENRTLVRVVCPSGPNAIKQGTY